MTTGPGKVETEILRSDGTVDDTLAIMRTLLYSNLEISEVRLAADGIHVTHITRGVSANSAAAVVSPIDPLTLGPDFIRGISGSDLSVFAISDVDGEPTPTDLLELLADAVSSREGTRVWVLLVPGGLGRWGDPCRKAGLKAYPVAGLPPETVFAVLVEGSRAAGVVRSGDLRGVVALPNANPGIPGEYRPGGDYCG